jgi:hypothetical protein
LTGTARISLGLVRAAFFSADNSPNNRFALLELADGF